jgi:hypothetical protein
MEGTHCMDFPVTLLRPIVPPPPLNNSGVAGTEYSQIGSKKRHSRGGAKFKIKSKSVSYTL